MNVFKPGEIEAERFPIIAQALRTGNMAKLIMANTAKLGLQRPTKPRVHGTISERDLGYARDLAGSLKREDIAEARKESIATVDRHLDAVRKGVGAGNNPQLVRRLFELGFIDTSQANPGKWAELDPFANRCVVVFGLGSQGLTAKKITEATQLTDKQIFHANRDITKWLGMSWMRTNTDFNVRLAMMSGLLAPDMAMSVDRFIVPGIKYIMRPEHQMIVPKEFS